METVSCCSINSHSSFHRYTNFHYHTKTIKSRPSFIVSVFKTPIARRSRKEENPPNVESGNTLLEKVFKKLDKVIVDFLDPPLHLSIDANYILSDNFAPVSELSPTECDVIQGSIPTCLNGVYIRNGPNPQFHPNGPHHYFDGDGMVHSIRISNGRATFCSRYVKTNKYLIERQHRSHVVPNVIGGTRGIGPFMARAAVFAARVIFGQYDIINGIGVANTNVSVLGGKVYALCESDIPYAVKVKDDGDVITLGHDDFGGKLSKNMTAHPKIDHKTKEAFAFRYWATKPYLTYFRFDSNGNKQPDVPIFSMEHPSLTHDLAITQKYAIVCETQIGASPMNLIHGGRLVGVDSTKVPRVGVLPRYANDESDMKWFEVPGFNIFHAVNAWDETEEDGSEVVVLVAPNILSVEHFFDRADLIHGSMEKVRINLRTGVVSRKTLSSNNLEFPVINPAFIGKKNKYVYAATSEQSPAKCRMMRVSGVAKLDIAATEENNEIDECTIASRIYGNNCFGGEPFFIARDPEDPNLEEDDGYVVCYVHDESLGVSKFLVMDARSPTLEVVAEVKLPQRVPYGLHGIFIREKDLNEM
ncbi:hypothetical protein Lser_V15G22969 [Lactuca serriola]